ncbi:neuropeptide SIFamide receptor-like isoform X2 [Lutzomyia longipalpis]|uniref:neuropeptide SIFamide receptor-like isoform X2 n=1 Tax=Lutzomyia longipalpis TaxID=7200 RepID=UPI002483FE49|nr:neuropeptide SIFamide receptor-like isoform X2 [Lutzomyia longipalpis]XP_055695905.1 neuropeptide SIFamide receptor-like isoform X2 [Lutzomyia longipalpis]XP_055695907.1 neuropeptide SIFamide receptor-like isoform X2 [Lutzomyia longipalpis]
MKNCTDGNITLCDEDNLWGFTFDNITNYTTIEYQSDPGFSLRYGIVATIFLSLAYGVVFVLGVVGNVAVVVVVFKSTSMRSATNQFIANLAIADLLVNFFCLPFTLVGNIFQAWILGVFVCKIVSYLQGVSVSASVNTLMAISLERCAAISFPLTGTMSRRQYRISVMLIWTIALTINMPLLFVFSTEPLGIKGSVAEVCVELWPSENADNLFFAIANLTICYLGPLTVISICYTVIWRSVANRSIPGERLCNRQICVVNRSKVVKMVFVVIVTFTLSWLPLYAIFCFVKFSGNLLNDKTTQDIIHVIFPIAQWLGAANSCINPILYAFMNRKFRVGFKSLIGKTNSTSHLFEHNVAFTMKEFSSRGSRRFSSSVKTQHGIIKDGSFRMSFPNHSNNLTVIHDQFLTTSN